MDSLSGSTAEANHPLLGEAQWQRTLVRACLQFEFYNPGNNMNFIYLSSVAPCELL